jgi:hypothetical protein
MLLFCFAFTIIVFMILRIEPEIAYCSILGCNLNLCCPLPLPPLSACNTTCNRLALCVICPTVAPTSFSPTVLTHQVALSVGAIAGFAVAGIVVAVIAVIFSDARVALVIVRV